MDSTNPPRGMVRASDGHEAGKVGFIELFFDLVYVFAITQLSHSLLHHYGLPGLAETTFLLIAVGNELAEPGLDLGTVDAVFTDARRSGAGDFDPGCVW